MLSPRYKLLVRALVGALCAAALAAVPATAGASTQLRGANMHPFWSDGGFSTYDQEFKMLQSAHANSVRIDLSWQQLQPSPSGYDSNTINTMTSIVNDANAYGLKPIVTFWQTPCWASSAPLTLTNDCASGWWSTNEGAYAPTDPQTYAKAAQFVAWAWGSKLAALELWNEPNSTRFLNTLTPAATYAPLVKAAYPAIKAVAPNLPVLATMAGTDQWFLHNLYGNGISGSYDGIAVHSYNDPNLTALQSFRTYQTGQGDYTPVWVTEFGAPSNLTGGVQTQSNYVTSDFKKMATFPWVAAAEDYEMRDNGTSSAYEDNFGMLYRNMSPKTTYDAVAHTLAKLP